MVDGAVATSAPIYAQVDFKGKNTIPISMHMKIVPHDINSHVLTGAYFNKEIHIPY